MYVPIMKNRTVEISVLQQLADRNVFNKQIIPLLELIQSKTRSNNKKAFIEDLDTILSQHPDMCVFVDFLKSTKLRSTTESVREYITQSVRHPEFYIEQIVRLKKYSDRVIPVISYLPENIDLSRISYEYDMLHSNFEHVAFRLKISEFDKVFSHIETIIKPNDYAILDIDSAAPLSPVLKKIYRRIAASKATHGFCSIVVNAHRPESLTNRSMSDKEPIAEIDNSLLDLYKERSMSRFDGFGDYACISAALPSTGGAISPVGIYYSYENNYFISYCGRAPLLSEFPEYIAPNIIDSEYWNEYNKKHHNTCPGCIEIQDIVENRKSGKNQAQWKMITMTHYIYTMFENNV